jgi:hypothetical protein
MTGLSIPPLTRQAVHGLKDALKVLALELLERRQRLGRRRAALQQLLGGNHAPHGGDALRGGEELVLGAHQADALRAVFARDGGVGGGVRVCEHTDPSERVHPLHEHSQVACRVRERGWEGEEGAGDGVKRRGSEVGKSRGTRRSSCQMGGWLPTALSPLISGALTGWRPSSTSPLEPLRESQSPSLMAWPPRLAALAP